MLCARRAMQAVNGAAPEGDGPGARALRDLKGDDAAARPTASFGRSYLADEAVAAACRAHAPDPGLDGRDVEFLDAFLASAAGREARPFKPLCSVEVPEHPVVDLGSCAGRQPTKPTTLRGRRTSSRR